jgi:hypothetical protein
MFYIGLSFFCLFLRKMRPSVLFYFKINLKSLVLEGVVELLGRWISPTQRDYQQTQEQPMNDTGLQPCHWPCSSPL